MPFSCLSEVFLYSQVAQFQKLLDHGTVQYVLVDEPAPGCFNTYSASAISSWGTSELSAGVGESVLLERIH